MGSAWESMGFDREFFLLGGVFPSAGKGESHLQKSVWTIQDP